MDNQNPDDYFQQTKEIWQTQQTQTNDSTGGATTAHYWPPYYQQPCPSCGRCPNCGRGASPYYPRYWW